MKNKSKKYFLGIDVNLLMALIGNIVSWIVSEFFPNYLPHLISKVSQEEEKSDVDNDNDDNKIRTKHDNTVCVLIGRPGGAEQLRLVTLKSGIATVGYNLSDSQDVPFSKMLSSNVETLIPKDCVVVKVHAFSVNYADCCIRWGLYESANEYVGYPIVPGFDVAGVVEHPDAEGLYKVGDIVFGCTLFGAYSTRALIPTIQLRKIPANSKPTTTTTTTTVSPILSMTQAASLPAVALTSLYALFLAGAYHPRTNHQNGVLYTNQSILIHSAAGGVGSMLVQMSKILGLHPIVGVVGRSSKVDAAKALGCDVVIDKSLYRNKKDLWNAIYNANNKTSSSTNNNNNNSKINNQDDGLYGVIMDCNGIETIQYSYDALAPTGRLILFGFHTNLPMGSSALSPTHWLQMAKSVSFMPTFQPMDMTTANKSVMAFNLSFFDKERELLSILFEQVMKWYEAGSLSCPRITVMPMTDVALAHELIQSGKTVGKIVLTTPYYKDNDAIH